MPYKPTSQIPLMKQAQAMTAKPQFAQYQAPNNTQTDQLAQGQVNSMLQQGGTLSPDVVAKLKARSKQQALSMADQAKQSAQQALAQKGWSSGGGAARAANATIDTGVINQILSQNRDTDIQAATTNRSDILNAVQAASQFMQGRTARAGEDYRNTLAGQGAQADSDFRIGGFNEDQRRFDNDSALKGWVAYQQAAQAEDDSFLRTLALQHGIDMDKQNFGERRRQFDNSLGFNYNQLNQSADENLMDYLIETLG